MPMQDVIEQARKAKLEERRKELERISLLNAAFVANMRARFPQRPDGTPWTPATQDQDTIKEYLKDATAAELEHLSKVLTAKSNGPQQQPTKQPEGMLGFGFIQPFLNTLMGMFNGEGGGFFGQIMEMFHKLQVSFNPGVALSKKELEASECSSLFAGAGKISPEVGKELNTLYRKLQQETYTDEQKINGLLRHVKKMADSKQAVSAHKLLKAVEIKVLDGKKIIEVTHPLPTVGGIQDIIKQRVIGNLTKAYNLANDRPAGTALPAGLAVAPPPVAPPAPPPVVVDYVQEKVTSVGNAVEQLVIKIAKQEKDLKDSKLTKEDKMVVYQTMQEDKRKLLHFIVKTDALASGKTLSISKQFDAAYMKAQLDKFPDSDATHVPPTWATPATTKSIFKLFNGNHRGLAAENLNSQASYVAAINKAENSRFKEMERQTAEAQKVVADLNTVWVKLDQKRVSLQAQIAVAAPQAQEKLQEKLGLLLGEQTELAAEAVAIQTKINENICNEKAYKDSSAANVPITDPAAPAKQAAIDLVVAKQASLAMAAANFVRPTNTRSANAIPDLATMITNAANTQITVAANTPITSQVQKFAVIKTLQENGSELLSLAQQARENLLPTAAKRQAPAFQPS